MLCVWLCARLCVYYQCNKVINLESNDHEDFNNLFEICSIFKHVNTVYAIANVLTTVGFNIDLHAFEVQHSGEKVILCLDGQYSNYGFIVKASSGHTFVESDDPY